MSRLFDSQKEHAERREASQVRAETRRRAEEADEVIREMAESDEASLRLKTALAEARTVAPVRYEEYRRPGSKWMIEHSRVGEDYLFQLHPLKPPALDLKDTLALAIAVMDVIFPRSLRIQYVPPSQQYKLKFYTIKVNQLCGLPGWAQAVERALISLSAMDVWPKRVN